MEQEELEQKNEQFIQVNQEPYALQYNSSGQNSEQAKDSDQREAKRIINRTGIALFILTAVVLGSQVAMEVIIHFVSPDLADSDWYVWIITAVSIIGLGLPVFYILMKRIPDSPKGKAVKMKPLRFIMIFFICAAAMYITNIFSGILTMAIAFLKGDTELLNPAAEAILNSNFILSLIYASVIAPIAEEIIFRKLLLDKLRRFGDIPAILMTGIAFGLFHMNLSQMFYAAVLGFIFAYVTIKTNTVLYSILLHMMVNFIGSAFAPLVSGGNYWASLILGQWVIGSVIAGIIFFIFNFKKIKFNKAEFLPVKKSAFVLNPGVILYILVCVVMIGFITIA